VKLLIVEDDPDVGSAIRSGLEDAGYIAEICRDGVRALRLALSIHFTAIVLDVTLPGLDGLSVCRQLRQARIHVPIIMLTARDSVQDRVAGLDSGADDYLCKPFEYSELLARIRALVRRDKTIKLPRLQIQDLVIETGTRRVWRAGKPIALTPREYALLEALAAREGQTMTREAIIDRVWLSEGVMSNMVDVYVRSLRRKMDSNPASRLIHSVYGIGYVLSASSNEAPGR
jgi:two-component system copper resistance phosphate regulon response regulator CusR